MAMTTEEVVKKNRSAWRMLLIGFSLGLLVSFLALVFIAFKWGPQGENIQVDLYSGHIISYKSFLWKHSQINQPKEPHTLWAIKHQDPVRSWYMTGSSTNRGQWFGEMLAVSYNTRSYIYQIYFLKVPEEEKVKLLHQYHKNLDTLKLEMEKPQKFHDSMEQLYTNWEQKLEEFEASD